MKRELPASTRRRFVLLLSSGAVTGLAGCLGDDDDETESEDDSASLPPDQQQLVETWIESVDDDLNVLDWRMFGDQFIPEYSSGHPPETDIPILADSYAEIVADGFEHETMPTAVDDEGLIQYMVNIFPEWALEYTDGEIDRSEYIDRIEETLH